MSSLKGFRDNVIAHVRPLLPTDFLGRAGNRFRETTQKVSDFSTEHRLRPGYLADKSIELGLNKLDGLANKEYAAVLRDFADAEDHQIETELKRRSLESKIRKEEADARAADAKARQEELSVVNAEFELCKKLKEAGVVLSRDAHGNLTILPATGCDLNELADQLRVAAPNRLRKK